MYRRQLGNKLRTLRPEVAVQTQVQEYYVAQYSLLLMMIFAGTVICLAVWIAAHGSPLLRDGSYVERNAYGEGKFPVALSAQAEGMRRRSLRTLWKKGNIRKRKRKACIQRQ